MKTKEQIAVENIKSKYPNMIVECFDKYVIIAHDELDLLSKKSKISRGDTFGFYKVDQVQNATPWPVEEKFDIMSFLTKFGCAAFMLIPVVVVIWIFHLIFK